MLNVLYYYFLLSFHYRQIFGYDLLLYFINFIIYHKYQVIIDLF